MVTVGIHCRTVGVLSEYCRSTVGVLSEYCRKLLSDWRTRAQLSDLRADCRTYCRTAVGLHSGSIHACVSACDACYDERGYGWGAVRGPHHCLSVRCSQYIIVLAVPYFRTRYHVPGNLYGIYPRGEGAK